MKQTKNTNPSRNRRNRRKQNQKKKKISHKVSDHFSKKDFVCQCGECKQSLKISLGLVGALELLRSTIGKRITIKKGYECPGNNETLKHYRKNYHSLGLAADITVEEMRPEELFVACESIEEIKGLGLNIDKQHVHIDTRKEEVRTQYVVHRDDIIELTEQNRATYFEDSH